MKRRIATTRLSKVYIARCGYTWLDESKWPQNRMKNKARINTQRDNIVLLMPYNFDSCKEGVPSANASFAWDALYIYEPFLYTSKAQF